MCLRLIYIVLLVTSVVSRHVPHFSELDENEQQLMRAAYDAPSYNQEYEEDQPAQLDLLKDGLWALKAKIKELTAFNKALAANMLATKLSVKELLKGGLVPLKKHSHEKPSYPAPYHAPAPAYPQYEAPPAPYAPPPPPPPYAHDPYAAPPLPQYYHGQLPF